MQIKVHGAGIMFSVIFGFTFMFSKVALAFVNPIGLIAYRFLVAFLVFELLRLLKLVRIRFQRSHLKMILLVAILQPVLYFLFEIYGLNRLASSEAGMMIALIPIFVSIFGSIFLHEKPKLIQLFFIVLSVSGIILIQAFKSASGFNVEIVGFLLLLGAVLSAALYNIASRKASKVLRAHELTYFMMLFGAVTFNFIYFITLVFEQRIPDYYRNLMQIELLLPVLYLGIVASIGGFFLINFALSRLEAHVASIYANLATITAIIAGALFLDESLFYYHYIGAAMIILGVYGTVRNNRHIRKLNRQFEQV